jgi:septum formation protein
MIAPNLSAPNHGPSIAVPPALAPSSPRLILASRSPRRALLLRDAGYQFTALEPPFADPPQPKNGAGAVEPEALVIELALAKAQSLAPGLGGTAAVVLGADTVVVATDGTLLGQPADRDDARRMLHMLMGATHRVVTGVALLKRPGAQAPVVFADSTQVRIGPVGDAELSAYLAGGDWRGKAGAYNLGELRGRWPIQVNGDPDTVVGLPMRRLRVRLGELGITPRGCDR